MVEVTLAQHNFSVCVKSVEACVGRMTFSPMSRSVILVSLLRQSVT